MVVVSAEKLGAWWVDLKVVGRVDSLAEPKVCRKAATKDGYLVIPMAAK
jgi:hypothetical protein